MANAFLVPTSTSIDNPLELETLLVNFYRTFSLRTVRVRMSDRPHLAPALLIEVATKGRIAF